METMDGGKDVKGGDANVLNILISLGGDVPSNFIEKKKDRSKQDRRKQW